MFLHTSTNYLSLIVYYKYGDYMKVYLDIIFVINFLLDFNILYIVNKVLKRSVSIKKIILSSLLGEFTLLFLFINISSVSLFIIKIILCFVMCLVSFGYTSIKYTINNMTYVYMVSTIYGGILYFIKSNINNKFMYLVILIILLPFISIEIIKSFKRIKSNYNYYYEIKINFSKSLNIKLNSFLDTGNKLKDPYTNKGIILVDINKISKLIHIRSPIYVPYKTLNNSGLIKCIKPLSIEINGKSFTNYLIGLSEDKFNIDGIDCILNYMLLEEL